MWAYFGSHFFSPNLDVIRDFRRNYCHSSSRYYDAFYVEARESLGGGEGLLFEFKKKEYIHYINICENDNCGPL